jgi:hypothetical protein
MNGLLVFFYRAAPHIIGFGKQASGVKREYAHRKFIRDYPMRNELVFGAEAGAECTAVAERIHHGVKVRPEIIR